MELAKAIRETRENIIKLLNESKLPIDVLVMMLKDIHYSVAAQADQMYEELMLKQKEEKNVSGDRNTK